MKYLGRSPHETNDTRRSGGQMNKKDGNPPMTCRHREWESTWLAMGCTAWEEGEKCKVDNGRCDVKTVPEDK